MSVKKGRDFSHNISLCCNSGYGNVCIGCLDMKRLIFSISTMVTAERIASVKGLNAILLFVLDYHV